MTLLRFSEAIDDALGEAMARDDRIVVIGEDVPMLRSGLFTRFGPDRIIAAPISESGFVAAAAGAAMAGLRPVVEVMLVDFIGVAMDALLNQIAKLDALSGGRWHCPLVLRAACGAGYGDGGQHEQSLWGMLAGIPGLSVVVPSTPDDARGLMLGAIEADDPVVFLEHKLLSESWLEAMGRGGRETVEFDVPPAGAEGRVDRTAGPTPPGVARCRREGSDLTVVSLAVGLHRGLAAAEKLAGDGISCEVIDLRSVRPLDEGMVLTSVERTGRLLVVDEDYEAFGLSGELAALVLEHGLTPRYGRVCVQDTLPYARDLEDRALPSVEGIATAARQLLASSGSR